MNTNNQEIIDITVDKSFLAIIQHYLYPKEMTGANTSIYTNKNVASLANPSTHVSLKTSTVADTKSDMSALSTKPSTFSMHDDSNIDHKAVDRDCEAWKETGAKMYLRVLTGSQAHPFITTKALVDTGDLGPSLVSDKCNGKSALQSTKWPRQ